jgi:hypothetical protein
MLYYKSKIARRDVNDVNCYACGSVLNIHVGYKKTKILSCNNPTCITNIDTTSIKNKVHAFFDVAALLERAATYKKRLNVNKVEYWINLGLSIADAQNKISEIQKIRGSKRKYKNSFDTRNLTDRGYSHEEAMAIIEERKQSISNVQVNFWTKRGYSEEEAKTKISEIQKKRSDKVDYSKIDYANRKHPQKLDYWVEKYNGDLVTAKTAYQEYCKRYSSNTSKSYETMILNRKLTYYSKSNEERDVINKSRGRTFTQLCQQYGHGRANEIINRRSEYFRNGGRQNIKSWSNSSKKLFSELELLLNLTYNCKCTYAENETAVTIENKRFFLDFFDGKKFVVEYYGDKFHANPKIYKQTDRPHPYSDLTAAEIQKKDNDRIQLLVENGYYVYIVWESDVNKDKNYIIQQILIEYEKIYRKN